MPGEAATCRECAAPLAAQQRYCLACGARAGDRSPQLQELLRRVADPGPPAAALPAVAASAGASPASEAHAAAPRASRTAAGPPGTILRVPPPKACALLVAAFLGFGILLGNLAGGSTGETLAANADSRLRLVVGPSASGTTPSSPSSASPSSSTAGSEPPAAEAEPAPAAQTSRTTASASKSPSTKVSPGTGSSGSGGGEGGSAESSAGAPAKHLPPIKHVFLIMLSDEPYASVFGPAAQAPYLAHTLEREGELLVRYDAVAHEQLANEVALLSGQGPTAETAANCPTYTELTPATAGASGQVLGDGCVYPQATQTLAGQLSAKHLSWRAYVQGTDEPGAQAGACAHPAMGGADPTAAQSSGTGPYATFLNPFVYFHSITGSPACARDDVGITALSGDLASPARTPSLLYIAPDRCSDGNPTPCAAGAPAGMGPANSFLAKVVPEITGSKAYKDGGLLVITVDEAPSSGEFADSSSCCGQPRFPDLPAAPETGQSPRGGGTVGALLLSPYVKAGTTTQEEFNHFSLLRTIEDLFSLPHLGYAALPGVKPFEPSMFTAGPAASSR